ncbi:hypothetical protein PF005_g3581 [Phytophthora fragariae]|uniref:Uncharacterized protein n=1 Tax=Phytophthora fragariae TaxID=53985 RepID=A0A6A3T6F7_9STRA|nr:hypothetical protein PF003_g23946 [Phytophthora fragariae]KAE8949165.1 hypothetical protein PF009_g1278 [Phytophthora fragariae]KAE9014353.1 hypothetical protein PF011_g8093 [Phytophthora fragariae]KAE9130441.1 hypothetical protein PF007_g4511 [Phytophthora fragariae]KAE9132560.1 hypothetical protein PF010_g3121 [Phytophthora fragariae]
MRGPGRVGADGGVPVAGGRRQHCDDDGEDDDANLGKLVRTVEAETTTETTSSEKSTTVETDTHEEAETEESSLAVTCGSTTSGSCACAIHSTVEARSEAGATAKPQRWQQDEA